MSDNLEQDLKQLIISTLDLEDIHSDDIDSEAPLFGDGLGLDSIDALELSLAISQRYGLEIRSDDKNIKQLFLSLRNLSKYIQANKKP